MAVHQPRHIAFKELYKTNCWTVKIYEISKTKTFDHPEFLPLVKRKIPKLLTMDNSFVSNHEQMAFLILHSGNEGIFSLMNWWVGENMLNTQIFLSERSDLNQFLQVSGDGLAPCIWEHEVIHHECVAWREHVLKQAKNPDLKAYFDDVYNGTI